VTEGHSACNILPIKHGTKISQRAFLEEVEEENKSRRQPANPVSPAE